MFTRTKSTRTKSTRTPSPRGARGRRPAAASTAAAVTLLLSIAAAGPASAATSGTWTDTANKPTPRYDQVAALLNDGRVLVAGGSNGSSMTAADVYNPATDLWTPTAPLKTARRAAAAVTLTDGRVLVAGGTSGLPGGLKTTEIYSPATGSWTAGPTMLSVRRDELAVRLADGRVLVAGDGSSAVPTGEVYNPATNKWTATKATGISTSFTAPLRAYGVLLPDGRVLTTLGMGYYSGGRPTIYNPATNAWTSVPAPSPVFLGWDTKVALLPNGHVLFAGGATFDWSGSDTPTNVVEDLDPVTGTWTALPSSTITSSTPALTRLADGRILLSGGGTNDNLYDPATSTWTVVAPSAGYLTTVTALTDGRALTVGGYWSPTSSRLFQP